MEFLSGGLPFLELQVGEDFQIKVLFGKGRTRKIVGVFHQIALCLFVLLAKVMVIRQLGVYFASYRILPFVYIGSLQCLNRFLQATAFMK